MCFGYFSFGECCVKGWWYDWYGFRSENIIPIITLDEAALLYRTPTIWLEEHDTDPSDGNLSTSDDEGWSVPYQVDPLIPGRLARTLCALSQDEIVSSFRSFDTTTFEVSQIDAAAGATNWLWAYDGSDPTSTAGPTMNVFNFAVGQRLAGERQSSLSEKWGNEQRLLTRGNGNELIGGFAWSVDGSRIGQFNLFNNGTDPQEEVVVTWDSVGKTIEEGVADSRNLRGFEEAIEPIQLIEIAGCDGHSYEPDSQYNSRPLLTRIFAVCPRAFPVVFGVKNARRPYYQDDRCPSTDEHIDGGWGEIRSVELTVEITAGAYQQRNLQYKDGAFYQSISGSDDIFWSDTWATDRAVNWDLYGDPHDDKTAAAYVAPAHVYAALLWADSNGSEHGAIFTHGRTTVTRIEPQPGTTIYEELEWSPQTWLKCKIGGSTVFNQEIWRDEPDRQWCRGLSALQKSEFDNADHWVYFTKEWKSGFEPDSANVGRLSHFQLHFHGSGGWTFDGAKYPASITSATRPNGSPDCVASSDRFMYITGFPAYDNRRLDDHHIAFPENVTIDPGMSQDVTVDFTGQARDLVPDVGVLVKLQAMTVSTIRIELIGPGGTPTVLLMDYGDANGFDLNDVRFWDEAGAPLYMSSGPYMGDYKPRESLRDAFVDSDPDGVWTIRVTNNSADETATLEYAELHFPEEYDQWMISHEFDSTNNRPVAMMQPVQLTANDPLKSRFRGGAGATEMDTIKNSTSIPLTPKVQQYY